MGQGRRASGLTETVTHILWRILFAPGHDACRITETKGGAVIDGAALFSENGTVANLTYRIECDADWCSRKAVVTGWIGERDVNIVMVCSDGVWKVSGVPMRPLGAADLKDVDLGFTPATNTNAIRRLNLAVGDAAETTALWLDVDDWRVKPLRQIYRRLSAGAYEYLSPDNNYRAVLTVSAAGLVTAYPDLWGAVET